MNKFEAYGKFLISGEYFILHGAKGLAVPLTKMHQKLEVSSSNELGHEWIANDSTNSPWFNVKFSDKLEIQSTSDKKMAVKLQTILSSVKAQRNDLFCSGQTFQTSMNFSHEWGMGSSSTLISIIAQWSGTNQYHLQKEFFGGSGYDIACATAQGPLIYQLFNGSPTSTSFAWNPSFQDNLFFIYLGKKQDSRIAMDEFNRKNSNISNEQITAINELTASFIEASDLSQFQSSILAHEAFISKHVGISPIKSRLFHDFSGEIKSLGGWGGDFILAATSMEKESVSRYFLNKGMPLVFNWDDLIKKL